MDALKHPPEFDRGLLAHVEHHSDGDRSTLVFVRHLRHSPSAVWVALTDPGPMRQWAPFAPDRCLATMGPAVLRATDGAAADDQPGHVLRAMPPTLLEYTRGTDYLRWELAPYLGGTRLTLVHTVDGPDWAPRTAARWHLFLMAAERLLDGRPVDRVVRPDAEAHGWDALHDAYAAELRSGSRAWLDEITRARARAQA